MPPRWGQFRQISPQPPTVQAKESAGFAVLGKGGQSSPAICPLPATTPCRSSCRACWGARMRPPGTGATGQGQLSHCFSLPISSPGLQAAPTWDVHQVQRESAKKTPPSPSRWRKSRSHRSGRVGNVSCSVYAPISPDSPWQFHGGGATATEKESPPSPQERGRSLTASSLPLAGWLWR